MEKQYYETVDALPTVKELREISKDRPDTFLNGALYIIDLLRPVNLSTHDREAWVKVEDGLPEDFISVIVWSDLIQIPGSGYYVTNHGWHVHNRTLPSVVTHWQPLPSPPSQ